ncbi:hypothetical protein M472_21425 [Sphingobacterium paucimobilis HER1398]|uniref:Uncharacterized protein n=1 Tax=Sphingobacterium paucimobilis HER1398 TaxID=1346330 RepID=U2J8Q1_9SPHI|nr:hypothetical protein M472_21425 [Sphingobacterium paucimobilis HER1398]
MFETTYTQKKLSQQKDGADFIFRFEFTLVYDDILGNSYEQKIMFYEDNLGKTNYHAGGPADFLKKNV